MEEIEVPVEKMQEEIHEHAHSGPSWVAKVALTSAILAVFAAIAALLAGHHSNEAMIEQIKASDHWSHYQAKSIKSTILQQLGHADDEKVKAKLEQYEQDQEALSEKAKEREEASEHHLRVHQMLAQSVTFFQIAITVAAISVLTRRRHFWWVSMGFGAVGVLLFILGLVRK